VAAALATAPELRFSARAMAAGVWRLAMLPQPGTRWRQRAASSPGPLVSRAARRAGVASWRRRLVMLAAGRQVRRVSQCRGPVLRAGQGRLAAGGGWPWCGWEHCRLRGRGPLAGPCGPVRGCRPRSGVGAGRLGGAAGAAPGGGWLGVLRRWHCFFPFLMAGGVLFLAESGSLPARVAYGTRDAPCLRVSRRAGRLWRRRRAAGPVVMAVPGRRFRGRCRSSTAGSP
jgi:hypothetical protein